MSRLKKFTRSLMAGYMQLGANIFYTLASVPLALHYLGKAEFGLWALVSQLGGYILLIDLGMSSSIGRILIDHKDDRASGAYGGAIKTGTLVCWAQAVIIILAGSALSFLAGSLLHVQAELRSDFVWLMIGQSALLGISFASRIFGNVLIAHQRLDIGSYGAAAGFFLNLAATWLGFALGWGVFSILLGQGIMTLGNVIVSVFGCVRLNLLPSAGEWGHVSRAQFHEMFAFGQGFFLMTLGNQLIGASQTILLTRLLGLETAAVWTICTRIYNMLILIVWRIADYSVPALSEMVVRREHARLLARFRDIAVLMASLGLLCGTLFALNNSAFVQVWTAGKIQWPMINNVLLGAYFLAGTLQKAHSYLIGATKELHFLRFIYLVEGSVFIGLNLLFRRQESMTLMLGLSLLCILSFSLPYSLFRTRHYFGLSWREFLNWLKPMLRLAGWLLPLALVIGWLGRGLPPLGQFALGITVPGLWGGIMFLRHGLEPAFRSEMIGKLPVQLQLLACRLAVRT
jgi:O-antigen/teichoic acid export membrane protein